MKTLLSGYDKRTQELLFRVYSAAIPENGKRQNHRLAHLTALDLLGTALAEDFGVRHAVIRRAGLGKPELIHDFLHMNLSHCRGLAVAAVGRMPLGVDAEAPRAVRDALMQKVCAPEELAQIQASDDKNIAFSRFWTLKEAYAKYTGAGIRLDFSALRFTLGEKAVSFHHPEAEHVRFIQLTDSSGCTVSLCFPRGKETEINIEKNSDPFA